MKLHPQHHHAIRAFTLAELVIGAGVSSILGLVFFNVLGSGLILFAKNTAVNATHEEARQGLNRLTRDIHASVSVPQLRSASGAVVSSRAPSGIAPMASGVSFQVVVAGPNFVWKDPTNNDLIMISDQGGTPPTPGQRLLVPFFNVEGDISKVTGAGTAAHSNIWLANARETFIASQGPPYKDSGSYNPATVFAITYYTERMMYRVEGGSYVADPAGPWRLSGGTYVPAGTYAVSATGQFVLSRGVYKPWSAGVSGTRYDYTVASGVQRFRFQDGRLNLYRQRYTTSNSGNGTAFWQFVATVANYVGSPTPFYVPVSAAGGVDNKYVGVSLATRDPKTTNRNYLSTASLLDTEIDYRSRLAIYQ
jgi:hypothetical protein